MYYAGYTKFHHLILKVALRFESEFFAEVFARGDLTESVPSMGCGRVLGWAWFGERRLLRQGCICEIRRADPDIRARPNTRVLYLCYAATMCLA
jgi:hypothetical protein